MAITQDGLKSAKRFGVRYGRTVKHKFAKLETEQRRKHKCPYCAKEQVKRISFGIWGCKICNAVFTARAYTVGKPSALIEQTTQLVAKAPEIREEEEE